MRRALLEAECGRGWTSPNPCVGAVLVRAGRIVATGYHRRVGGPHAEIEALRAARGSGAVAGATMYVTLEPCSTEGRTPPCVTALIAAGIGRVVVGAIDPNPRHAGRGLDILRAAGIEVAAGVLGGECEELNAGFNRWITAGRPLVIAKAALGLDGRIARPPGESRWISCGASRRDAHALRARVDAIVVGAGTVRADRPRLTVRYRGGREGWQPWRIVLSRSGDLPRDAPLFRDAARERTSVLAGRDFGEVLEILGGRGITSLLLEGGAGVLGEAFAGGHVDRARFYLAPLLAGGALPAIGGAGAAPAVWRAAPAARTGRDLALLLLRHTCKL